VTTLQEHVADLIKWTCLRLIRENASQIAPPPDRKVARYSPTPELVHGVEVSSPQLAALLRSLGVFSGKPISGTMKDEMLG
jgi:hypothetical protein